MTNSTLLALLELLLQRGQRQIGVRWLSSMLMCRVGGVHASKVMQSHGIGHKMTVFSAALQTSPIDDEEEDSASCLQI